MLKQRIITAAVLFVAFALLLSFAPTSLFAFAIALIVAAAAWEWGRLCGLEDERVQNVYAIVVGALALIATHLYLADNSIRWILLIGLLFWLSVPVQFYLKPMLPAVSKAQMGWLLLGLLVLPIAAISILQAC